MRTKNKESQKDRFNRVTMTRFWSVPFHVKMVINPHRSWIDGLTSKQLLKEVQRSLKANNQIKKANKIKLGSIYSAVSKINDFCVPPFYIDCQGRMMPNGKFENRYFVPSTESDVENAKGRKIREGSNKFHKAKRAEEFGDTLDIEEKQKQLQEIKILN
jgi:hypothetical protein